jgi:hypothetical protein
MDLKEIAHWAESHPVPTIVIGAGGLIAVLYLLGYFSPSPQASSGGDQNVAAAYYAAEAAQAQVGGAIQVATIQAAAATAMNASNNNAAVAIDAAQTGAAQTINAQNVNGALGLGDQQLQATYNSNATAASIAGSNNQLAGQLAQVNLQAYNTATNAAVQVNQADVNLAAYQSDLAFLSR